jgi:HlyD family secretion protein
MDIQRPGTRKRRNKRLVGFIAVGAALVFLMVVAFSIARQPPGLDKEEFFTSRVRAGEFIHEVTARGEVYAPEIRSVTNKSAGVVEVIYVLAGHQVEPDTIVMELSNPNLEQELADAITEHERAKADEFLRQATAEDEFLNLQSSLADNTASFETAQLEADAEQILYEQGASSDLNLARQKNAAAQHARRVEIAQLKVDRWPDTARTRNAAEQAKLDQQQRKVDRLRERVDELHVRAGFSGVVQSVETEEGRRLGDGTEVARVINPDDLIAQVNVSERDAQLVLNGQPVRLELGRDTIMGEVERISPAVTNRQVEVDVAFVEEPQRQLRPELSVVGRILVGRVPDTLIVERPTNIRDDQTEAQLYRLTDGGQRAERTLLAIGRMSAQEMEILNGLEAGDEIITSDMTDWLEESVIRIR